MLYMRKGQNYTPANIENIAMLIKEKLKNVKLKENTVTSNNKIQKYLHGPQ